MYHFFPVILPFLDLDNHLVKHVLCHFVVLEVIKKGAEVEGGWKSFWIGLRNSGPTDKVKR